jgi:hypothetical protein
VLLCGALSCAALVAGVVLLVNQLNRRR